MKNPKLMAIEAIKKDSMAERLKKFKKPVAEKVEKEDKEDDGEPSLTIRIARLKDKK